MEAWLFSMTSCGGLGAARVARQPAALAQRAEAVLAARDDLVDVGLVPGVPDDPVARRVEDPVQREGDLDDAEARAEVPTGARDRVDEEVADLRGEDGQLAAASGFRSRDPGRSPAGSTSSPRRPRGTRRVLRTLDARTRPAPARHSRGTCRSPRSAASTRATWRPTATSRRPSRSYAAPPPRRPRARRRRAGRAAACAARPAPPRRPTSTWPAANRASTTGCRRSTSCAR